MALFKKVYQGQAREFLINNQNIIKFVEEESNCKVITKKYNQETSVIEMVGQEADAAYGKLILGDKMIEKFGGDKLRRVERAKIVREWCENIINQKIEVV
jgi:hypothetical protein